MKKWIINLKTKYPQLFEIIRFLIVGGLATIIDFLVTGITIYLVSPASYDNNFLNIIGGDHDVSTWTNVLGTGLGFIAGLLFNYFLSIIFVFVNGNTTYAKTKKGFIMFSLFSAVGFFIHTLGMWLFNGVLGVNLWIVKIVLTIVVLIFNYWTRKKFIFGEVSEYKSDENENKELRKEVSFDSKQKKGNLQNVKVEEEKDKSIEQ
jgi:putative flippase GtrA